ncbi:MAG: PAS domain-containing protein [Deltaproteobacteria bacterium]|nr:PAS domain-containing protein [Deltaproteobacteria bacterium]
MKDTLNDIVVKPFETLRTYDTLAKAAQFLKKTKFDGIPVINSKGKLTGVMTKSNLYDAVSKGFNPDTPINDFYIKDPVTIEENLSYSELFEIVKSATIGTGIVINNQNVVTGVFNKTDWIQAMFQKEAQLSNRLKAIYDTMHNGLIAVDSKGDITDLNSAAEMILSVGFSAIGKPANSLLPNLDINRTILSKNPQIGIKYQHNNINLLCNITPVKSYKNMKGAIIVIQDTTDLARIVSELANVTHQYETLESVMEIAYDGIVVVDQDCKITMLNRVAENIFNKKNKDLIGKKADGVIDNTKLHIVVKTGMPQTNKIQLINSEPFVVTTLPIKKNEKVIGAVCKIIFRDMAEVKELAERLENLDQELAYYKEDTGYIKNASIEFDTILTNDPDFMKLKKEAEIASRGVSNILITGESGTGKELFAKAIHMSGICRQGPLVRVNCAAIPDSLLESEFFGYAKGAFTGASEKGKIGKLQAADGGTLFLDEIGDMSISLQSKLLRVLQDQVFEPVGSNMSIKVNVRFIAATNQDLSDLINRGKFRKDLFYRLNVIHLALPSLRNRINDIELLASYFLEKYNRTFGTSVSYISKQVLELLNNHDWPGNVRELENVIERAINFAGTDFLEVSDLPIYLQERSKPVKISKSKSSELSLKNNIGEHETELILEALEATGGNKAKAARILGISRSWLYKKIAKIDI